MAFIDEYKEILWEVIEQNRRGLPGVSPCKMTGIVLNPLTIA
jgi:hypothetical protein